MNNSSKEVLKIHKLNAIYPNSSKSVLNGLDLNMNRGDRLALVGRSGCGKSTVAKAVMQLLPAGCICKGEIFLNGKNVLEQDKVSLQTIRGTEVGLIFQDPISRLNPLMTVGDHLVDTFRAHDKSATWLYLSPIHFFHLSIPHLYTHTRPEEAASQPSQQYFYHILNCQLKQAYRHHLYLDLIRLVRN